MTPQSRSSFDPELRSAPSHDPRLRPRSPQTASTPSCYLPRAMTPGRRSQQAMSSLDSHRLRVVTSPRALTPSCYLPHEPRPRPRVTSYGPRISTQESPSSLNPELLPASSHTPGLRPADHEHPRLPQGRSSYLPEPLLT